MDTDDFPDTSNEDPHEYCGHVSQVLVIFFTGNEDLHGYSGYASQVLMISLRILMIVYTGCYKVASKTLNE